MWKDIRAFYGSKEWELARLEAIQRATDRHGRIIDQYTGEPIGSVEDIIVHHKIELTPSNVNNLDISINQDNLMVVTNDSHNQIHERMGYGYKKVIFVWGSSCSGKSTYVKRRAGRNDIILDLDRIYEAISINERYNKPKSISGMALTIRNVMMEHIKMRDIIGNAYVISSEPLLMKRERLIQKVNADEVIYMETTQDECLERLYNDSNRQNYISEQEKYINDFFDKVQT